MKIYTKGGDFGETGLPGGERISKSSVRTEAYGTLDELNSTLGLLLAELPESVARERAELLKVQSDLYSAACHLAGTGTEAVNLPEVDAARIEQLEARIDAMTGEMPELNNFILPGGSRAAAQAHVARTVCRRAERRIVAFYDALPEGGIGARLFVILRFVNRLSDYLFTLARAANHAAGISDTVWKI